MLHFEKSWNMPKKIHKDESFSTYFLAGTKKVPENRISGNRCAATIYEVTI